MPSAVASVAVPTVSMSDARNSGSLASARSPRDPPLPTRPTSGATRNSRNSDAASAAATLRIASRDRGGRASGSSTISVLEGGSGDSSDNFRDLEWDARTHGHGHAEHVQLRVAQHAL